MGARSRRKGARGEREFVALAREAGFYRAERSAPMQAATGDAHHADLDHVGRLWVECKRHRRVNVQAAMRDLLAVERPGLTRVLLHRSDDGPALATLEAADLLRLEAQALGIYRGGGDLQALEDGADLDGEYARRWALERERGT